MTTTIALIAQAAPAQAPAGISPLIAQALPLVFLFAMAYFLLIWPMRSKQKKLEALVKALQPGDKVVINPGILGTVVAVEEDALQVRIDEKTKMRVYRSAIAGLQPSPSGDSKEKH